MRLVLLIALGLGLSSCGPRAFTKGEYDDPTRVELLDDKFNEADMQQMADSVVGGIVACKRIASLSKEPVVIVEKVQNRTEEHIDTASITEKVSTALINSGKVRFVSKEDRGTLEEEYNYNESGNVSAATQRKRGKQTGADYVMNGAIATNVQQVGNDKYVYYKLTMKLVNLDTSEIDCVQEKEIRKKFRKRSVGL